MKINLEGVEQPAPPPTRAFLSYLDGKGLGDDEVMLKHTKIAGLEVYG